MLEIAAAGIGGMVVGGAIAYLIAVRVAHQQKTATHAQTRRMLAQRERQYQTRLQSQIQHVQSHHDAYYDQVLYVMRQLFILWNSERTELQHSRLDVAIAHEQNQTRQSSYVISQRQLHEAQQQQQATQERVRQLEQELTATQLDRDSLKQELDHAEAIQQQLEQELETATTQIQELWQNPSHYYQTYRIVNDGVDELFQTQFKALKSVILAQPSLTFSSVLEAIEFVEFLFPTCLEIWESARQSASTSRFPRPFDVYKNIYALAQVGQDYFENNGNLGRNFYQAFQDYGVIYVDKESESTQTNRRLLQERVFRHHTRTKTMMKHLKVGTGKGENTLRIYFEFNLTTQRVEIGYCGAHLKTSSIR